jgi:hypothetical protein
MLLITFGELHFLIRLAQIGSGTFKKPDRRKLGPNILPQTDWEQNIATTRHKLGPNILP